MEEYFEKDGFGYELNDAFLKIWKNGDYLGVIDYRNSDDKELAKKDFEAIKSGKENPFEDSWGWEDGNGNTVLESGWGTEFEEYPEGTIFVTYHDGSGGYKYKTFELQEEAEEWASEDWQNRDIVSRQIAKNRILDDD